MSKRVYEGVLDARPATALLVPRRGLVLEVPEVAPIGGEAPEGTLLRCFRQGEGPLRSYQRMVSLAPQPNGRYVARQVVELTVDLPWWSWLVALPLRASLSKVGSGESQRMPWWAPPQRLDRRAAVVVATLGAVVAVQGFLAGLLPETLTYAASQMHAGTLAQGVVFGAVALSSLPALAALVLADRRGRRLVVLWATAAAVVFSALGALAPTVVTLTASQVASGAFVAAAGIAAVVVAVEEVTPGCRAWAVGVLGMAAGLGGGIPLALLPLAGTGPGGWRLLYAFSLACLPVVIVSARTLPESRRWEPAEPGDEAGGGTSRPPIPAPATRAGPRASRTPGAGRRIGMLRSPAERLALVCAGAFLLALFAAPASEFQTQFLRHQRHYSPLGISVLEQFAGTIGGLGVLVGGRLADTHGRRAVAIASVVGATAAALGSYLAHGWFMWGDATASQFFGYAAAPALGVYGVELFATSSRARCAGLVAASSSIGEVGGLLAAGALTAGIGTIAPALGVLAIGPALLVVLLVVAYPETAGETLEDLAPKTR